jgi:hypothetical protein
MKIPDSLFTDLDNPSRYLSWRDQKLARMPGSIDDYVVPVKDPVRLTDEEHNRESYCKGEYGALRCTI